MSPSLPIKAFRFFVISLCCLSFFACDEQEKRKTAKSLLSSFAGSCPSYGSYTQKSLEHAKSIVEALAAAQAHPACQSISGLLPEIQKVTIELERLNYDEAVSKQIQAEQEDKLFTLELATTTDPQLQILLTNALGNSKVDKIRARAESRAHNKTEEREGLVRGLTTVSSYLKTMQDTKVNLSECLRENPFLGLQLSLSAAAIAGSFFNPALGPALVMVGQAFNIILDQINAEELNSWILKFEDAEVDQGLMCSLESLSNHYCDTVDMERMSNLFNRSIKEESALHPFWESIETIAYRLPTLFEWLQTVATGADSPNKSGTIGQTEGMGDYSDVLIIRKRVRGILGETKASLDRNDVSLHEQILRSTIDDLSTTLLTGNFSGTILTGPPSTPFSEFYGSDSTNMLFLLAQDRKAPVGLATYPTFANIEFKPPSLNLTMIAERVEKILQQVDEFTSRQLKFLTILDAPLLLKKGITPLLPGQWTPLQVLTGLYNYFQQSFFFLSNLNEMEARSAADELKSTQQIIRYLAFTLMKYDQMVFSSEAERKKYADEVITEIFDRYILTFGRTFLEDRVMTGLRWDLNFRLQQQAPKEVNEILLASAHDIVTTFFDTVKVAKRTTINLKGDLERSKQVTLGNLKNVAGMFKQAYKRSLERAKAGQTEFKETKYIYNEQNPFSPPHQAFIGKMCLLLLTTQSSWPVDIPKKYCQGTLYDSGIPTIGKLEFDQVEKALKDEIYMEKRVCKFRDFVRQGALTHPSLKRRLNP